MLLQSTPCLTFDFSEDEEEWRPVVGFELSHEVSNLGNVRSLDRVAKDGRRLRGKPRALVPSDNGYLLINFVRDGKAIGRSVHSLVADAFLGPCPDGYEINHKHGDKHDNRVSELEYVTPSQNHIHAIAHGLRTSLKGIDAPRSKLTEDQVRSIRREYPALTTRALAAKYGMGSSTVQQITSGKIWKHLL